MGWCGLDYSGLEQGKLAGYVGNCNENSGLITSGDFLDN
jgi:hypothetical protein